MIFHDDWSNPELTESDKKAIAELMAEYNKPSFEKVLEGLADKFKQSKFSTPVPPPIPPWLQQMIDLRKMYKPGHFENNEQTQGDPND